MRKIYLLSICFSLFTCFTISAQSLDSLLVSGNFTDEPLEKIIADLSATYQIRFFYPKHVALNQPRSIRLEEELLPLAIDRLLAGTPLSYLIYRSQAVVIGPEEIIGRDYGAAFYRSLQENLAAEEQADEDDLLIIGSLDNMAPDGRAQINGTVKEEGSGEPVVGATLYFPELSLGTATDEKGQFVITLPTGTHLLRVQYVGYPEKQESLVVYNDGEVQLSIRKAAVDLETVIVEAQAPDVNVANVQIGVTRLDVKSIRELPSLLGEADVFRTLLLQPGVSTVGEGAGGFNVRGGNVDQNLIMQGEAFLFNSSHALGFFSTFNTDLLKEAALYKSIIPAQYGGRLASVLDVELREGNFEKFAMQGGISPITGRLSLEGPVIKQKASVIAGGRYAFVDWLLDLSKVPEVRQSSASFYDLNLQYSHLINEKNRLTISGYRAFDRFRYAKEFGFEYQTSTAQLLLRSIFNDRLFSSFSAVYSEYKSTQDDLRSTNAALFSNSVSYAKFKEQLSFVPGKDLAFELGLDGIYYWVQPGTIQAADENSSIAREALDQQQGLETAAFFNAEWNILPAFSVSAGLRFNLYFYLGPQTVFLYAPGQPPSVAGMTGTEEFSSGESIASHHSLEPRLSLRYRLGPAASVKAGYSRTSQFINQISNADAPTPTSLWQLSTSYIEPQRSHNFSAGYFRNFGDNNWEGATEIYYRNIDALFDYRDFAELNVNEHLETELLAGIGRAYGLELSLKKRLGTLNGWLSYTLSRTERMVEGINLGDWYPANFDKLHDLSIVLNVEVTRRNRLSINFNYQTGRPTTAPAGSYTLDNGLVVPDYLNRNQLRIPDYHRLDLSYTLGQGYNKTKKFKTSWTISVYNAYSRRNPYSVYYVQQPFRAPSARRLSILGSFFPSITFNFELI